MMGKQKRKRDARSNSRKKLLLLMVCVIAAGTILWAWFHASTLPRGAMLITIQGSAGQQETHWLNLPGGELKPFHNIGGQQFDVTPDGRWLAYNATVAPRTTGIYILDLTDPDAEARLLTGQQEGYDGRPSWSPDGSSIVFVRTISPFSALFRVDVDTGTEIQLTPFDNSLEPDWSPDGEWIVFTSSRDGFQELYTMAPDGSDVIRLTHNEQQNDLLASYSPDGSMIAYMSNYSVSDGSGEIWLMKADGSDQQRLTHNEVDDRAPVWSPDGACIAFTTTRASRDGSDIQVSCLADGDIRKVTNGPSYAYGPFWSPDSQWIAYRQQTESNNKDLLVVRRDGSDRQRIINRVGGNAYALIWLDQIPKR